MGRDAYHWTKQEVLELMKKLKTAGLVAKELNVSLSWVYRKLKEANYKGKPGPKRGASRGHSTFGNWLRENPDLKLPRSPSKLAKMSGCTESAVRNYMYHERRKSREIVKNKPWFSEGGKVHLWTDIRGAKIPDRAFKEVYTSLSSMGRIKFVVRLKSGGQVRIFYLTSYELEEMYDTT